MNSQLHHLLSAMMHLGIFGPVLLGILDSSFFFFPFGNDLLVVLLVSRDHQKLYSYVPAAAVGSALGVFLLDMVARKGGEQGLQKLMKPKRFDWLKKKIGERAAFAIVVACIAPPPFPFTAAVAAASALQYPKARLLTFVFVARCIRFVLVGIAAIWFGTRILVIAKSTGFQWFLAGFIILCVLGSVISVRRWIRAR